MPSKKQISRIIKSAFSSSEIPLSSWWKESNVCMGLRYSSLRLAAILLGTRKTPSFCHRFSNPLAVEELIHGRDSYDGGVRQRNASHQSTCFFLPPIIFISPFLFLSPFYLCFVFLHIFVPVSSPPSPVLVLFEQNGTMSLLQPISLFGTSDFVTGRFGLSNCMAEPRWKLSGTKGSVWNEKER
jgi:hypothetical protein